MALAMAQTYAIARPLDVKKRYVTAMCRKASSSRTGTRGPHYDEYLLALR
jgi:hypothetical protein